MNSSSRKRNSVSERIEAWDSQAATMSPSRARHQRNKPAQDDDDTSIQGLTPAQISVLAQKVYDLLLDELRIEAERHGRGGFR